MATVQFSEGWFHEWFTQNGDKTFTYATRVEGSSRRRRGRLYANRRCRPHAQLTRACGRSISATVRPRPRAGSEPSSCGTPSIPRARWCAGRCAARRRPERLQSFGTIMLVLAMPLQLAPSTKQVLAYTARSPCATTTQPTHRLLCVHGRRPSGAALEAVLCGC